MEKGLGQEAIDALFAALDENLAGAHPQVRQEVEPYNFSRSGQISNDQMRAIGTVNELFARNLMHTVGAWLRSEFQVALVSGEQQSYAEFVDRVAESNYISSARLEPLGAPALLEVDVALVSPMVDLLLGGTGKAEAERPLTDIEDLIMLSVVQMIVKELNVAWMPVGLNYTFDKRESLAAVARMMPDGEKTLCVCFEVQMPEARGVIKLCLPAVVLNTILRKMNTETSRPRRRSPEMVARLRAVLGDTAVGAVLQFPPVRLCARELSALAPGYVLRLPIARHEAAELRVGGLALGRARAVRMGEHRGARMEAPGRVDSNMDAAEMAD